MIKLENYKYQPIVLKDLSISSMSTCCPFSTLTNKTLLIKTNKDISF